jgi:hypothetical protein
VDESGVVDCYGPDLASEFGGEIWEQGEGGGHDPVRNSGNIDNASVYTAPSVKNDPDWY